MFRILISITLTATFSLFAFGQDPTKAAPEAYKLQFENEWVKVFRVHYAAHSKVPVHDHSKYPAAYVYLSDAGQIKFIHSGWEDPILVRRPVKARAIRLSPTTTVGETHEVENPGDLSSDFLRIELKTRTEKITLPHLRFAPDEFPTDKPFKKVLFENGQVRISRLSFPAGMNFEIPVAAEHSLIVIFSGQSASGNSEFKLGDTIWLNPRDKRAFRTLDRSIEILRFDLK